MLKSQDLQVEPESSEVHAETPPGPCSSGEVRVKAEVKDEAPDYGSTGLGSDPSTGTQDAPDATVEVEVEAEVEAPSMPAAPDEPVEAEVKAEAAEDRSMAAREVPLSLEEAMAQSLSEATPRGGESLPLALVLLYYLI